jgi:hypothetical protein
MKLLAVTILYSFNLFAHVCSDYRTLIDLELNNIYKKTPETEVYSSFFGSPQRFYEFEKPGMGLPYSIPYKNLESLYNLYNNRNIVPQGSTVAFFDITSDHPVWFLILGRKDLKKITVSGNKYELELPYNDPEGAYHPYEISELSSVLINRAWMWVQNSPSLSKEKAYKDKEDFILSTSEKIELKFLEAGKPKKLSEKYDVLFWFKPINASLEDIVNNVKPGGRAIVYARNHNTALKLGREKALYFKMDDKNIDVSEAVFSVKDNEGKARFIKYKRVPGTIYPISENSILGVYFEVVPEN